MAVKRTKTPRRSEAPAGKVPARKAKPAKSLAAQAARKPAAKAPKAARKQAAPPAAKTPTATSPIAKSPITKSPISRLPAPKAKSPLPAIVKVVEAALDDMKAVNIKVLDVRKLTDIADTLIIASGNSDRHVRSIADRVIQFAKKEGFRPTGVEGERDGEWVLVDLRDVIVHIMLPRIREFYRLENLWDVSAARREAAAEK
jgi:ribosome-associated protein